MKRSNDLADNNGISSSAVSSRAPNTLLDDGQVSSVFLRSALSPSIPNKNVNDDFPDKIPDGGTVRQTTLLIHHKGENNFALAGNSTTVKGMMHIIF